MGLGRSAVAGGRRHIVDIAATSTVRIRIIMMSKAIIPIVSKAVAIIFIGMHKAW